ncbi:cytochrome c-type biogenesis protein [Oceanobacter kriegii]|uniref:cytochrome c-type biogenesis protein n=1 Tax=Oceanobacter kriegii TaxID=64972 RepID=UPI0004209002|nr:cytochrome c-type biogenesis protein [Oceanobacter kriegii]
MTSMKSLLAAFLLALTSLFSLSASAVVEGYKYQFDSEEEVQRFNGLAEVLRCPKCQNQNLADSNAPVASDMREKVYELMLEGQSDDQIVDYLVARYGDFVHYKPPVRAETWLLWFGPLIAFLIGLLVLRQLRRKQTVEQAQPLTEAERAQLERMKSGADSSSN